MTDFIPLVPGLAVAGQLTADDFAAAAAAGFKAIVNHRPDGEQPGQLTAAQGAELAAAAGLAYVHQPVAGPGVNPDSADIFRGHLAALPGPVLAHCRSGTRTTTLWAMQATHDLPVDRIIHHAGDAGYDLSPMAGLLDMLASERQGGA